MKTLNTMLCGLGLLLAPALHAQDDWTLKSPATKPSARRTHAMAPIGGDQVLLFGGNDAGGLDDETWIYDLSNNTWTLQSPATKPSARYGHAMTSLGGDQVLLFGGFDAGGRDDETWVYDLSDNTWTLKSPATKPSARDAHAMASLGGAQVLLFGGFDAGGFDDETWVYDLSDNTWTLQSPATKPSARFGHAMASLGGDQVLLFGGYDGADDDETWVYDLSDNTWTLKSPATKPSARNNHAMASLGGDQVLLFGGFEAGGRDDETWVYDLSDNTWTLKSPATKPSARAIYAMASLGGDQVLLFGGSDAGSLDDETWVYTATPASNLTINNVTQNEINSGTSLFTFTVSLSAPAGAGGVTFDIATQDNSATTANSDYAQKSLTGQTIPAGSSTYMFSVTVNGDLAVEPDETFFVNVTNVTGAVVTDGQGQGKITNDDVSATVSGGGTICADGSAKITVDLAGASPFTIVWSDGVTETGITSTPHDRFVSPAVNTTYTITSISNAIFTGTSTGSALVTVNPLPTATVSGGGTICTGGSTTISAALTGTGPWSITWSDGFTQAPISLSPATRTVSPSITTTYTITAVSDANCSGTFSGSALVTVAPGGIPTASVSGGGAICAGKSTTIRATLTGTAPWTITWSDGFVQSNVTTNPAVRTVSPSKTTIYTVTALASGACAGTSSGSATVQVNKLPKAIVRGDATICDCGSTDITVELSGTPPWTINWADGTVQSGITERTFKRTVKRDKTYRIVSVKDGNGCSSAGEDKATIHVLDEAVFAARDWVKIGSNLNSEGAIYTNGYIEFGAGSPGKHTGDLSAGDDIVIKGKNQISGNVKAGDLLQLAASSQIIGTRQAHAEVDKLSMPHDAINPNGPNKTVPAGVTLNLPPGSYGKVLVKGTLVLTAGRYNLRMLSLEPLAILSINVAGGEVKINVGSDLNFANNSRVEVSGGSPALVWFTAPQDRTINIGADAVVQGKIIGADADVIFGARSRFKGSVCARTIRTEPKVIFLHYSALGTVAKDAATTAETAAEEAAVVTAYELAPNYPNPFSQIPRFAGNVGTEITFALPEAGKVSLNVYSTTGQLVRTLVDRELEMGRHQAQWNGRNEAGQVVAAGVYLYRITVQGRNGEAVFTATRRLTFLK